MIKLLLTLTLFVTFSVAQPLKEASSYEEAIKQAQKVNKPVLAFVYASYCPWCDKMKERALKRPEIIDFINKTYVFVRINKETDEYPQQFNPRFVPTTYVIDANTQEEIYALYGYKTPKQFLEELDDEDFK
jgi:thioredoxin-related protein